MRKLLFTLLLLCTLNIHAKDILYLKNGSIIKGEIIEYVPDKVVKITTADGSMFVFDSQEVIKIAKEPTASHSATDLINSEIALENPICEDSIISVRRIKIFNKNKANGKKQRSRYAALFNISGGSWSNLLYPNQQQVWALHFSTTHGAHLNDYMMIGGGIGYIGNFCPNGINEHYLIEYFEARAKVGKKLIKFTGGYRMGTAYNGDDYFFYTQIDSGIQIRASRIAVNITPYTDLILKRRKSIAHYGLSLGLEF